MQLQAKARITPQGPADGHDCADVGGISFIATVALRSALDIPESEHRRGDGVRKHSARLKEHP